MATEPTSPPTVDALPTAPSRSAPSTFRVLMDAFLAAMVTFRTQAVALASWQNDTAQEVYDNALESATSASNAATSAAIAVGLGDYQGEYNAGTTYAIGESVTNPPSTSFFIALTENTGVTPVNGANWYEAKSTANLGTAANKDTGTSTGNVVELIDGASAPALPAVSGENLTNLPVPEVLISEQIISSAQTYITFTLDVSEYSSFRIEGKGWRNSEVSNQVAYFQISTDGGSTWTIASGDVRHRTVIENGTSSADTNPGSQLQILSGNMEDLDAEADYCAEFEMKIFPGPTGLRSSLRAVAWHDGKNFLYREHLLTVRRTVPINAVRFYLTDDTTAGEFRLFGHK